MATGKEIFDGLVEYPLPDAPGVKDYVFYCGNLGGYGVGAKAFIDKHWPAHVPKTAASLQDVMTALQTEVTSGGVQQIRELMLVAHANTNQLFLPVVPAGADVDTAYTCVSAWSLAKLQGDIAKSFPSFDQARKAVIPHLLDNSWVTIRACNIGNSAEAMYALYAFFGGRADVYAPTKYMAFGDCIIRPGSGYRIDSKFGVYDYLVKQHFLSSREHTPKRQAAIVTDLIDPESFSAPFQLATAHLTGGDLNQAAAYQQLVAGLNQYAISADLKTAFATAGHPLSTSAQVVTANDIPIDKRNKPSDPSSVWYVRDTSLPDGGQTIDLVYQICDATDDGGASTLEASAQLAVDSAYPSIPFQVFFDQSDHDAYSVVVGRFAGYADQGPYADQRYKDAYDAIKALLSAGKWTDGTNDIAASMNSGLANASFDPLPDPLPPIQPKPGDQNAWLVPITPQINIGVELEAAPDGSPLHTIIAEVDLAGSALDDWHRGVLQERGRVPHTPGTEIAAYLDRYTADELATFMDYVRSRYVPAYAYYVDHALAAIERKRDFMTWMTAQPDFADPLPAHLILRPGENQDLRAVAYTFDFNDNWIEVKQHSKYTATVQSDLFSEGSLTDKLHLTGTYTCGTLPPDSFYFSRAELKASQSQGHEQYFAASKNVFEPPAAQVDTGCADFRAALEKWKALRDANATPDVMQQSLEELLGEDGKSAWERMKHTLEPLHMGTELWDWVFEPEDHPLEYRAAVLKFSEHWVEKHVETEWLKGWLTESLGTTAEIIDVLAWIKVPFDLWMDFAEAQQEAVEYWDLIGQLVAIRQWLRALSALTNTAPFPSELNIDIGGADQAVARWIAEQRAQIDDGLHGAVWTLPPFDLSDGYARAAVAFGRIGPQIVEQADKYISEKMAESGLSPCTIKAMIDVGLYDPDALRRRVIREFADALRNSLPQVL
jgi:hypothetical protein